jgi:hypothetical protein
MVQLYRDPEIGKRTSPFDIAFQIGNEAACTGADVSLGLDPVVVCRLMGMNCTIGLLMRGAYFADHHYPDDFEMAVLAAVNAGGNNMARGNISSPL